MNKHYATESFKRRCGGFGVLGWIALVPAVIALLILLVFGFYEGRKAYWDSKVREMCEKDGGVTVFEHVTISEEEYERLRGIQGGLPIPFADDTKNKEYPYFRDTNQSRIREWNPEVARLEMSIKRRSDGKILARSVHYWRRGGDIPTGIFHDSSFGCPEQSVLSREIFRISGGSK